MRYYRLINTTQPEKPKKHEHVWPPRSTVYENGDPIPEELPNSYQHHQDCRSCIAYNSKTTMCSTYKAPVWSTYWCHTWAGE